MLIFVYGTLKRGKENHHFLAGQRFVADARTEPHYRLFDLGGYPGMVAVPNTGLSIGGEVWEVNDAALAELDVLEDTAGGEYVREVIALQPPFDQQRVEGYRYLWDVTGCRDCGHEW